MITQINASRLTEIINQSSSESQSQWYLRLYTIKPGGKRFVFREDIAIPPIEEDIIPKLEYTKSTKSTSEFIAELRSMGGFSTFKVKK